MRGRRLERSHQVPILLSPFASWDAGTQPKGYVFWGIFQVYTTIFVPEKWGLENDVFFWESFLVGDITSWIVIFLCRWKPCCPWNPFIFFFRPHFLCWLGQETIPDDVKMIYNSKFLGLGLWWRIWLCFVDPLYSQVFQWKGFCPRFLKK